MSWSAPLRSLAPLGPDSGHGLRKPRAVHSVPSRFQRADLVTKSRLHEGSNILIGFGTAW